MSKGVDGYLRRGDYRLFFPVAILATLLGGGLERFGQSDPEALDAWWWAGAAAWFALTGVLYWTRVLPRRLLEVLLCAGIGGGLLLKLVHAVYLLPLGEPFGREIAEFALWIPTYFGLMFLWFGIRAGRRVAFAFLMLFALVGVPGRMLGSGSNAEGLYVLGMLYLASAAFLLVLHVLGRTMTRGDEERRGLEHLTMIDDLTGIANRRALGMKLGNEIARVRRYGGDFSVLLLDVDHFKQINDQHGHQAGDGVLRELARLLERECRDVDTVGRWGGEEFMAILPEAHREQAATLATRLRQAIGAHHFRGSVAITASVGVAWFKHGDSMDGIVKRADDALYLAKERGRNRIETAFALVS